MQKFRKILSLILAGVLVCSAAACSSKADSDTAEDTDVAEETAVADEDSDTDTDDSEPENTATEMNYTLDYDSSVIPDDLAQTIANYFYSIEVQDFDLYSAQLNPIYAEKMEAWLQENDGYGLETGLEEYKNTLDDAAGDVESYQITSLSMDDAATVLADNFDEDTDFVSEYLETYSTVFGEDFITELEDNSEELLDIAVTVNAVDGDGNDLQLVENIEMLIAKSTDGTYGILG